jgi:primosomal protein N' (replication factor Y)
VEEAIAETFPQARIARMDLDTTRTRNAYERIIAEFAANKTNLLIGTQMVTKGLDFSGVSVVGILSADSLLNQPDFRAFEHAFTMMTQVAGRAGRKGQRGRVILQTSRPTLPVIRQIVNNDYRGFYNSLMQERQEFCYPPFSRLIYIYLKHREDSLVDTAAIELANMLRNRFMAFNVTGTDNTVRVLGPDRPVVSRIKQLYIRKIIVKVPVTTGLAATRRQLHDTVAALRQDKRYKAIVIFFDVDPT